MLNSSEILTKLNAIGQALSNESRLDVLLELILASAKQLTHADGGSVYVLDEGKNYAQFSVVMTDSLGIRMGGSSGEVISFPDIPLKEGEQHNTHHVVSCALNERRTINIKDVYDCDEYDFSGTQAFDRQTGYHTTAVLTVPMIAPNGELLGAIQLINPIIRCTVFDQQAVELTESLASQAAIALHNRQLVNSLEGLFEAVVHMIATAIDDKSPYTGGHCRRVPLLTMKIAEVCHQSQQAEFASFVMTERDRYELSTAAWLHDCGKITTPEYVMDKSTKLEAIMDGMALIDARFEVLRRDKCLAEVLKPLNPSEREHLCQSLGSHAQRLFEGCFESHSAGEGTLLDLDWSLEELDADQQFLRCANIGAEYFSPDDQARVRTIAQRYQWLDSDGIRRPLLTEHEVYNLCIQRGTLNAQERTVINHHMNATVNMLESLPFPEHLKNVPEYACAHHEKMNGKGYPKGLDKSQMSIPARIMAVADIFEALTASDRPYKQGKSIEECLSIMDQMAETQHIDADIYGVFKTAQIPQWYMQQLAGASMSADD